MVFTKKINALLKFIYKALTKPSNPLICFAKKVNFLYTTMHLINNHIERNLASKPSTHIDNVFLLKFLPPTLYNKNSKIVALEYMDVLFLQLII